MTKNMAVTIKSQNSNVAKPSKTDETETAENAAAETNPTALSTETA